ncbi:hypothetical protein OPV22_004331 [Ensete ventricosum]|uniref:Peroxin-13 n=1 Tax=Ensete ventricosum TaxID=4639 RepID=A0AAV8S359_ENSVE|nr:hypothetical protein OPV22_004331 [Ensete ventricosum]
MELLFLQQQTLLSQLMMRTYAFFFGRFSGRSSRILFWNHETRWVSEEEAAMVVHVDIESLSPSHGIEFSTSRYLTSKTMGRSYLAFCIIINVMDDNDGGLYGGNMYNRGFGGPMNGYGMGMGGSYGNQDPNNSYGPPPSRLSFRMSFLQMQGVVNYLNRMSILIDQHTQSFHISMTALLQLFYRSGSLYGELLIFVLRVLGIRRRPRKHCRLRPGEVPPPSGCRRQGIELD